MDSVQRAGAVRVPAKAASDPDIHVEVLSGHGVLDAEAGTWQALAASSDMFVQHQWVTVWQRAFADPAEFILLKARRGADVVGYLPLLKRRSRWRMLPVTTLCFCANEHSTWGSVLLSPDRSGEVADAFSRFLLGWRDWHVMLLPRMPLMSAQSRYLLDSLLAAGAATMSRLEYQHIIEFPDSWDDYVASLSRNFRDNLRRTERKLAARQNFRLVTAPRELDLETAFAGFVDVDRRSWKHHSGETVASRSEAQLFYAGLVETFGRENRCWIALLEADGAVISAGLFFEQNGIGYGLKTSSDAGIEAGSMSLGHLTVMRGFAEAHRRGVRTMHTLSGAWTWGRYTAIREPIVSALAYNNRQPYGRVVEWADRIATGFSKNPGRYSAPASRKQRSGQAVSGVSS